MNVASQLLLISVCVIAALGGRAPLARPHHTLYAARVESPALGNASVADEPTGARFQLHARVKKPKFRKSRRAGEGGGSEKVYTRPVSKLPCGVASQVGAKSDKNMVCPDACPYYSQDLADDKFCSFKCVQVNQCAENNPQRPIADKVRSHRICRGPLVPNCAEYNYDGTDACKVCQAFHVVGHDGQCHSRYFLVMMAILVPLVIVVLAIVVWFINISRRPVSNKLGLKQGLACRSQEKVATWFKTGRPRSVYPVLCTNLLKQEDVAGPGMLLHFSFQLCCMIWAFGMAAIWYVFVSSVDEDMFILGTRNFGTPRENCVLVAWGYETQQRLMPAKVTFVLIAYAFTFLGSLLYSIRQQRMLDVMNASDKTMRHFAAVLSGITSVTGDGDPEGDIARAVSTATGQKVVGVSICWGFGESNAEDVTNVLDEDLKERQSAYKPDTKMERGTCTAPETFRLEDEDVQLDAGVDSEPPQSQPSRQFFQLEKQIVDFSCGSPPEPSTESDTVEMLKSMESSGEAFVVFETEAERNLALEKAADGIKFQDTMLEMKEPTCEPDTVNWENLGPHSTPMSRMMRLLQGFGWIFVALSVWGTLFYAPYFYGQITFNYENGAMPPASTGLVFTLVVCAGNAIMYEVCARVSDNIGFKTKDDRESCYLVLYVIACTFNVLLDFVCTYLVALKVARGFNFRTYFGVKIDDVENFTDQFETYAMQRILAQNAFDYAWPSTFLIPFILEPFVTVYFPYKISQLLVRTHPEWTGRDAELWLACIPFDMGRYGDLQLNMLLGLMIFFFPSGYTLTLFLGMGFAHVYIYAFDHWKVLSAIPRVIYANGNVDWYSQWMMAPITATLASCLAFKGNCQGFGYCVDGNWKIALNIFAWVAHTVIHTLALVYLVPLFKTRDLPDPHADMHYSDMSVLVAANWFNENPVHCLRSKLIHKHSTPISFMYPGKEHLLNYTPNLGCYFKDQAAEIEDYSSFIDWKAMSDFKHEVKHELEEAKHELEEFEKSHHIGHKAATKDVK